MNLNAELIFGRDNIIVLVMTILRAPFLEPFEVFHVAYCYSLLVAMRFTRIYAYGDKGLIQSVSSEKAFTFLRLLRIDV